MLLMMCYIHIGRFFMFSIFCPTASSQTRNLASPWMEYHENFATGMKWLLFVGLSMWMSFDRQLTCDFMLFVVVNSSYVCRFCLGIFRVSDTKTASISWNWPNTWFSSLGFIVCRVTFFIVILGNCVYKLVRDCLSIHSNFGTNTNEAKSVRLNEKYVYRKL